MTTETLESDRRRAAAPRPPGRVDPVIAAAGLTPAAARVSRVFDILVVIAVVLLFTGAIHLHTMLLAGDWDMFTDWKDRQYWPLIMPVVLVMFPAALQAVFWTYFRLPIGATVAATCLMLGVAITRPVQFMVWTDYPLNLVLPAQMIASALVLDVILMVFRNALFTAIFGGFAFAFIFYPANYIIFAPYYVPVAHQGMIASVADMIGYVFPRSATPEYIRIIERGTLRTFGDSVSWVSALFSGFICIFMHYLWWKLGIVMSSMRFLPNNTKVMAMMGAKAPAAPVVAEPAATPEAAR
ncbi:MAG: methane monooxygenase/ammonia monooxygenase subunit A [Burkholderiales bacterium]|jgi:methane/ammonia monooxygenase subunit A|nr:methane monooxygenase/ammonia monooxygenase subunit A [Burkholderiales bacterium]